MKRSLLFLSLSGVMLPVWAQSPAPVAPAAAPVAAAPAAASPKPAPALPPSATSVKQASTPVAAPVAVAGVSSTPTPTPSAASTASPPASTCAPCAEAAVKPKKALKKKRKKAVSPVDAAKEAQPEEKVLTPYEAALAERQEQQALRDRQALENSWTSTASLGCSFLAPLYAMPVGSTAKTLEFSLPPTGNWKPARLVSTVDWVALSLEDDALVVRIADNPTARRRTGDISLETGGLHCSVPVLQEATPGSGEPG